jgi:hypothetical protein
MNGLFRTLLALSLLVLGGALTCGADDTKGAADYYPLAVGNTWQYKVGTTGFILKVTKKEKVKTEKGEVECARVEFITTNNKTVSFEHIGVAKVKTDKGEMEGIVRYTFEGKPATPPILFLELPPKDGSTWKVDSKIDGQVLKGTFTSKLTNEKGEKLEETVPAGKYRVVTVTGKDLDVNGRKMSLTYYFADKVGMVKQVIELEGQKVVIELEKFEPAKS